MAAIEKVLQICPVTSNAKVVMQEEEFRRLCHESQVERLKGKDKDEHYRHKYCRVCKGKIHPPGLVFKSLAQMIQEREESVDMAAAKNVSKKVKCPTCGGEFKSLVKSFDKEACTSCTIVRSKARSNPEMVMRAIRRFHVVTKFLTDEEKSTLAAHAPEQDDLGRVIELEKDVQRLKEELDCANKNIEAKEKQVNVFEKGHGEIKGKYDSLSMEFKTVSSAMKVLEKQVESLSNERDSLVADLQEAQKEMVSHPISEAWCHSDQIIEGHTHFYHAPESPQDLINQLQKQVSEQAQVISDYQERDSQLKEIAWLLSKGTNEGSVKGIEQSQLDSIFFGISHSRITQDVVEHIPFSKMAG